MGKPKRKESKENHDFASEVLSEELMGVLEENQQENSEELFDALMGEFSSESEASVSVAAEMVKSQATEKKLPEYPKAVSRVTSGSEKTANLAASVDSETFGSASSVAVDENATSESAKANLRVVEDKTQVLAPERDLDKTRVVGAQPRSNPPAGAKLDASLDPAIELKNADYINFAQNKIKQLEAEVSKVRRECEDLAIAGEHFKNLAEERFKELRLLEEKNDELESYSKEEKKIFLESSEAKDSKIEKLEEEVKALRQEQESKFNRVRLRERELESRLEILKQEQLAVTQNKDEMLLKLKKKNNILHAEIEKIKDLSKKSNQHLQEKEDALRRTMKALKLSLTMLESQNKE